MLVLTLSNQLGNANTVPCDLGQNFGISPNWDQVQAYSIGGDAISPASLSEGWIKLQQPRATDELDTMADSVRVPNSNCFWTICSFESQIKQRHRSTRKLDLNCAMKCQ